MLGVSNSYRLAIKRPSRTFKSNIIINGNVYSDSEIINFSYEEHLYQQDTFTIGTAIMGSIEVELLYSQRVVDDFKEGEEFRVEIGLETNTNIFEFIPLGVFAVEDIEKNNLSFKVTAYDRMCRAERDYYTSLEYPATLYDITQEIADNLSLILVTSEFINHDYVVSAMPDFTDFTFREVLRYIGELTGGYSRINRNGELEFFNIDVDSGNGYNFTSNDAYSTDIIYDELSSDDSNSIATYTVNHNSSNELFSDEILYNDVTIITHDNFSTDYYSITADNYISLTSKMFFISKINQLVIEDEVDHASIGTGNNAYYITDNIFCSQNKSKALEGIYSVLNEVSFIPYELKTQGDPAIQTGDKVTIRGKGSIINTLVTSRKLTYSGGIVEEYKAIGKNEQTKATYNHTKKKAMLSVDESQRYLFADVFCRQGETVIQLPNEFVNRRYDVVGVSKREFGDYKIVCRNGSIVVVTTADNVLNIEIKFK